MSEGLIEVVTLKGASQLELEDERKHHYPTGVS